LVEAMVTKLRNVGALENTYVMFTSDNGAAMGAFIGSIAEVGIDEDFIKGVRQKVTEGISALFALTSGATAPEKIIDEHSTTLRSSRPTCPKSNRRSYARSSPKNSCSSGHHYTPNIVELDFSHLAA
jgi:arylsulfatase A-like enzyme